MIWSDPRGNARQKSIHFFGFELRLEINVRVETTKDSIKYIKPVFAKTANGNALVDKADTYDATNATYDPWQYDTGGSLNADNYRKALYEETRDRPTQELANVYIAVNEVTDGEEYDLELYFKDLASVTPSSGTFSDETLKASKKWGPAGENYVDGYITLYADVKGDAGEKANLEKFVVAIQDRETKQFFSTAGYEVTSNGFNAGVLSLKLKMDTSVGWTSAASKIYAFGRYNGESDFAGDYLGEVEIRMAEYQFRPSATSIGVSWSQLTELTLDTSFNVSAEEYLVTYASQEIRAALDYRAIKLAYSVALTNTKNNANYLYKFDAQPGAPGSTTKEGYLHNAQTFMSAIDTIGDVMFDEIKKVTTVPMSLAA